MTKPILGYVEHVSLPDFGIDCYAKVDTGACTSSLHADDIEPFTRDGEHWVRFRVQFDNAQHTIDQLCEAPVIAKRKIASSNGQRSSRYIIMAHMNLGGESLPVEISLSHRGSMKYPMLIGRKAIEGKFLVDVSIAPNILEPDD